MLHGGTNFDGDRSYGGIGFKVDLPGFFLISPRRRELNRQKKKRGLNTSFYWKSYIVSRQNQSESFIGNKFGFSADTFLSENYFLNFDIGLYSDDGNQFFNYGMGLGYEF